LGSHTTVGTSSHSLWKTRERTARSGCAKPRLLPMSLPWIRWPASLANSPALFSARARPAPRRGDARSPEPRGLPKCEFSGRPYCPTRPRPGVGSSSREPSGRLVSARPATLFPHRPMWARLCCRGCWENTPCALLRSASPRFCE